MTGQQFPPLSNGQVRLRPLGADDLDWVREAETGEYLALRWRLRGAHPNPRDYADQLWTGTLALFAVERSGGEPIGILSAYQADHRNGHCRVAAAQLQQDTSMDTSFLAGLALFLDYLFTGWPFRKLYFETPEYNLAQFASAVDRGLMRQEARLEDFVFLADRYWDVLFLSTTRDAWSAFRRSPAGRYLARSVIENAVPV